MVYSPVMGNFRLSGQEAGGQPDYGQALREGFQTSADVYKPKSASESLLAQMLQNKMNIPKAEHAEENERLGRMLQQAQINSANKPDAITGETAQLFALRNTFPEGSKDRDVVDAIISRKSAGGSGTTVFDPTTGQPLVQIGGSSGRGAGGGSFINPVTGETMSQPTGATATNLQGRVVGTETVKPYFESLLENLPQFQNPGTQISLLGQKVANAFGGQNFSLPSQQAAGKASLKEISEGLLKSFGLNATGANRKAMEEIVMPTFGESPQQYTSRVQNQVAAYAQNEELARSSLRGGISTTKSEQSLKPVSAGDVRVYFPDGPHVIPKRLLDDAMKSGATMQRELPNG